MNDFPLLVEFVSGTTLYREPETIPKLPIVQNGPPGTFVVFSDGRKVPLPTDQIVFADDSGGSARVGFGGMSFEGLEKGYLVFYRVRDLRPEEELSPQRGRKMTLEPHMVSSMYVDDAERADRDELLALEPHMVSSIYVDGRHVWPLSASSSQ